MNPAILAFCFKSFTRLASRGRNPKILLAMIAMLPAVHNFIEAHDRYLALDNARSDLGSPRERELLHIEIMKAYLEVQYRARIVAGLQYADGMDFAELQ